MAYVRVATTDQIPVGQGMFVQPAGVWLAVFNAGAGRYYACSAVCPHEDGPLAEGWLEAEAVVCPWHGFDFDLVTGQCRVEPGLAVPVYPVRVTGGVVEVDLP